MNTEAQGMEAIVQRQFDAYNAHDVETLALIYAEDAQQYEHPDTLIASGLPALRQRLAERFNDPLLEATLLNRIVIGSTVIDHESIRSTFSGGPGSTAIVAIYQVRNSRIAKAWFIIGARVLEK